MPDMVVNRVEVEVGDSPDKGLELIKTILGNRRVQQSLLGLNVRLDNETRESLAYIFTKHCPQSYQAEKLQFFSYVEKFPQPYFVERKTELDKFIIPAEQIHPYDVFILLKLSTARIPYEVVRSSPTPENDADYTRNIAKVGHVVKINGKTYFETTAAIPSVLAKAYFKDCK